jgi:hypothetical protein
MELSRERGHAGWGAMPSTTSTTHISVHIEREAFEEVFRMSTKSSSKRYASSSSSTSTSSSPPSRVPAAAGGDEGEDEPQQQQQAAKKARKGERNKRITPGAGGKE